MGRIALAWELGGGSGHLERLSQLAVRLIARGHSVSLVSRHEDAARRLFHPLGVPVEAAPVIALRGMVGTATDSYAHLLLQCGLGDAGAVTAGLLAWQDILRRLRPDLVIADLAPAAMLAARWVGVPVAAVGSGFAVPPPVRPLPFARPWETVPAERLDRLDADATGAINAALRSVAGRSVPELTSLSDLFPLQANFLCTVPELDHYPGRGPAEYFGPIFTAAEGTDPVWPSTAGPRVFAYLNGRHPSAGAFMDAARTLDASVLLYVRNVPGNAVEGPSLRVVRSPVRMEAVLAACDAVVCQGIGTVSAALLAGKPVVVIPLHLEQMMIAYRLISQGLGVGVDAMAEGDAIRQALRRVLHEPGYRGQAAAFAAHYHGFTPDLAADAVADACESLL